MPKSRLALTALALTAGGALAFSGAAFAQSGPQQPMPGTPQGQMAGQMAQPHFTIIHPNEQPPSGQPGPTPTPGDNFAAAQQPGQPSPQPSQNMQPGQANHPRFVILRPNRPAPTPGLPHAPEPGNNFAVAAPPGQPSTPGQQPGPRLAAAPGQPAAPQPGMSQGQMQGQMGGQMGQPHFTIIHPNEQPPSGQPGPTPTPGGNLAAAQRPGQPSPQPNPGAEPGQANHPRFVILRPNRPAPTPGLPQAPEPGAHFAAAPGQPPAPPHGPPAPPPHGPMPAIMAMGGTATPWMAHHHHHGQWQHQGWEGTHFRHALMHHVATWALFHRPHDLDLSPNDVGIIADAILLRNGQHTWKVGDITQNADHTVSFAYLTAHGDVIARFTMNTATGRITRTD